MADDFFNLAQLENPQMLPSAPIGGGALAGLMYGRDKARQDSALQGAAGLAQLNAMLQQQHASEDMAGAPGRMDTISRNNQLAAGGLANAPTDVDTGGTNSRAANIKAHLDALTPYAMSYRDTMSQGDFQDLRDQMKTGGITKIGSKNLDDLSDDQLERVLKDTKNYAVNTPGHLQAMEKQGLVNQGWDSRIAGTGDYKERIADKTIAGAQTREQMRDSARLEAVRAMAAVQSGKLNNGQYRSMLMEKAKGGDTYSELVLNHLEAMDLAKANAAAQNQGPHLDVGGGTPKLAPPAVPTPPPFPMPNRATPPAQQAVTLNLQDKTATVNGKKLALKGYNATTGEYLLEDGSIVKGK